MNQPAATFAISDLAREFGITPRTIRFWEDQGILAPEREGSKRIFTANGYDAFLVVFQQYGPDTYKPVEALGTRPGARTIAFDEKTRKLYTLVAEGSADFDKKINTGVGPFYPNTYFPDTLQVLTYGRK